MSSLIRAFWITLLYIIISWSGVIPGESRYCLTSLVQLVIQHLQYNNILVLMFYRESKASPRVSLFVLWII